MSKKVSVIVKSPIWNEEARDNWLKFRTWIEANGGEWLEGMGKHKITFQPIEESQL